MTRRTSTQTDSPPSVVGPGTTPYGTRTPADAARRTGEDGPTGDKRQALLLRRPELST